LTKVRKFSNLADESNLQLNDDKKVTSVAQTKSETKTETKVETKTKTKEEESKESKGTNDCALNGEGK
jgi:hypothetical protein